VSVLRQLKKDREKSGASSSKDRHIRDESTETTTIGAEAHPIIDVKQGYLLGASTRGRWLSAEHSAKLLKPGKTFRVFSLNEELGNAKNGELHVGEICPKILSVPLTPEYENGVVAVEASWNPLPRSARTGDHTERIYMDAVRTFLIGAGIKDPQVKITQVLFVDLYGDGKDEALISATNYFAKNGERPDHAVPGSYSVVLLRSMLAGKARMQLVVGEVYPKAKLDAPPPNWYQVSAILDLDGDGKMDVLVNSEYYEGGDSTIYRCSPAKVEKLLSVGCGL
jgi:FG-GAP repeat protein